MKKISKHVFEHFLHVTKAMTLPLEYTAKRLGAPYCASPNTSFDGGEMIRPMSLEKQKIKCWGYDPEEATKLFK
jgi:hypothetical protein